jgi:hypothetical protein
MTSTYSSDLNSSRAVLAEMEIVLGLWRVISIVSIPRRTIVIPRIGVLSFHLIWSIFPDFVRMILSIPHASLSPLSDFF